MLEDFMEKLSRDMELDEPLKSQIPGVYTIPLEEGLTVTITSSGSDRFAFSATLGDCPAHGKEEFFTQLLLANLFGQGTKGAVLGLDIEANQITLTQNIDHHVEYKEFRDTIEDFLNVVDFWRQEIITAAAL